MTLPPLPEPKVYASDAFDAYTTEQLREYARAAIAAHVPEAVCGNIAAVPAHPVIRTLSPEQIERHTFKASECPPDSVVMLVSSINRLLSKRPGEGIRLSQPVAWLCSLMMEDGTTRTQIVEQDPAGLRWNDDGEPSPYKVQPLYAAPQAVPVPADMALTDDPWRKLYRRAINEANGLTNYVEDRPELRGAERRLAAIEAEARTLAATFEPTPEKKP